MNYIIFFIGTIFIILVSWFLSIRFKRYHGIARFFAFESIFILILLNIRIWFVNPFSLLQIFSWILLILSAYVVISGFSLLSKRGKSENNFENTSVLVKSGIYKYIRHPMYSSLILLGCGIMLKDPGIVQLTLGLINLISIWFTAKIEEREMITKFGNEYREYIKETKMLFPFII